MNIEVTLRLSCTSFSRQAHEQITLAENLMRIPVQIVFVNVEVGHILLGIPVKACIDNTIEGTIQLIFCKQRCLLLNFFVVVNHLIDINVILAVCIIKNDELARNRRHDISQRCLNQ